VHRPSFPFVFAGALYSSAASEPRGALSLQESEARISGALPSSRICVMTVQRPISLRIVHRPIAAMRFEARYPRRKYSYSLR
jgi:hypothetical protein